MAIAARHCRTAGMKYHGWLPWSKFVSQYKETTKNANNVCDGNILKRSFRMIQAKLHRREMVKLQKAMKYNELSSHKSSIRAWMQRLAQIKHRNQLADFVCSKTALRKSILIWGDTTQSAAEARLKQERVNNSKADQYAAKFIPRRVFRIWIQFVTDQKEEKWREYRRNRLREAAQVMISELGNTSAIKIG